MSGWNAALIAFAVLLFLMIILIIVVLALTWKKIKSTQNAIDSKAYMTAVSTGTAIRDTGAVNIVVWSPTLLNQLGDWKAVESTVDSTLVGWEVPKTGSYLVNYSTIALFNSEESVGSMIIVNGQSVQRSWCPNVATLPTGAGPNTAGLTKTFMLNLDKTDVVSLILVISAGTSSIPTDDTFAFATTLTMTLVNPCGNNDSVDTHSDFSETGFFVGPASLFAADPVTNAVDTNNIVDSKVMGVEGWVSQSNASSASEQYRDCMCSAQTPTEKLDCSTAFHRQVMQAGK